MYEITHDGKFATCNENEKVAQLPSGYFAVDYDNMNGVFYFAPMDIKVQIEIGRMTKQQTDAADFVMNFFSDKVKARFGELGFVWKMGTLFHGAPGTGKTICAIHCANLVVESGGIVLYEPRMKLLPEAVRTIRESNPDCPILVIKEDCEGDIRYHEHRYLQLLDGQESIDGCVFVMTTNHIQEIPERITRRPSRINRIYEFGCIDEASCRAYVVDKGGKFLSPEIQEEIVVHTISNGKMTIDDVKSVIIAVGAYGLTVEEAMQRFA